VSQRALLLIGSPKGLKASNSARYGEAVAGRLETAGWRVDRIHAHESVATFDASSAMCQTAAASDLVLLVAPLYVDTLPGPMLRALEILALASEHSQMAQSPAFCVLIHCGFIEPRQNETAVALCKEFAEQAGWEWRGGLMLGGGGIPSKRARRTLGEAADALARGDAIAAEIAARAAEPTMPRWLYILGGNAMWRRVAKKQNVSRKDLRARPYA